MGSVVEGEPKRVCIIGAGVVGLVAIKLIKETEGLLGTVFEQTDRIGGLWHYVEDTDTDVNQLPVNSGIYAGLRTNTAKAFFALDGLDVPDYENENGKSFISHANIERYLLQYAEKFGLLDSIQLNTRILSVKPNKPQELGSGINANEDEPIEWSVDVFNYKTNTVENHIFDAVIVGNGKYSNPLIPNIEGIKEFAGQVLHTKSYRRPEQFKDQHVIIIGLGPSSLDIGREISSVTEHVTVCHCAPFELPSTKSVKMIKSGISRVNTRSIVLESGEEIPCDALLFATGYNLSYPFLHSDCGIRVEEGKYVTPLYKMMMSVKYPTLCIPNLFLFAAESLVIQIQMRYFVRYLQGLIKIPTELERSREHAEEENEWNLKNVPVRKRFRFGAVGEETYGYVERMAKDGGFPDFVRNINLRKKAFFINFTRIFGFTDIFRNDKVSWTSPTSLSYYCYSDPKSEGGIPEEYVTLKLDEATGEVTITSSLGKVHNAPFGNF